MTSLREAARALLDAQLATLPERLYLMPAVRAALNAPPLGLEEVRAKLEELWRDGVNVDFDNNGDWVTAKRNRLIAELLVMWERS